MTGFEPQTSDIGSDHSTNWATTTATFQDSLLKTMSQWAKFKKEF